MTKESLVLELEKRCIELNDSQANQLIDFMHAVLAANQRFNLTAIKNEDEFLEKMIFDSALALNDLDLSDKTIIDVGTGAGFPGEVLKILCPNANITFLDSTTKKINFLKEYNKSLKDCNYVSDRAEIFAKNNVEKYDFAFARAVSSLPILLELIIPMLKVGGTFVALKGPNVFKEINESNNALKKLGCKIIKIYEDELPESNEDRTIIYIQKTCKTPIKYPREYKNIVKRSL